MEYQNLKPKFTLYPEKSDNEGVSKSEPASRTSSFKEKGRCAALVEKDDSKRRNSLPLSSENLLVVKNTDLRQRQPVKRVRSFRMTSKGSASFSSENKTNRRGSSFMENDLKRQRIPSTNSDDSAANSSPSSSCAAGYFRVIILGAPGVGKSTLAENFLTSEYMSSNDLGNDVFEDKTLSVEIDNEESTLEFIDFTENEENIDQHHADSYIVVFSVHDRDTFDAAQKSLDHIRNEMFSDRAIILVANKVDLVRKRQITADEARTIAKEYDCKYIETSATLNHKVDELLVGLLQQIKLKLDPEAMDKAVASLIAQDQMQKTTCNSPKKLLHRLFRKGSKTKCSCDNLFEL